MSEEQMVPRASGRTTISGRPRRRAVEACTFCRRRKIKCNNEQPICANCKIYEQVCIYVPLHPSAEPKGATAAATSSHSTRSKARPRRTAKTRLSASRETPTPPPRERLSTERSGHDDADDTGAVPVEQTGQRRVDGDSSEGLPQPGRGASVSRVTVASNNVSSYHGHTSTLYEEQAPEREAHPRVPDDWVEKGLVAEAARQRQLEEFNFHTGRLDFDDVDPDLGMHLLNLHWNRQHHSFNITYRPAFMRDMACSGPYFSKLLLNALYFGASKFSPRLDVRRDPRDVRTAGWKYRERVRKLLGSALDRSDITTIQALLIMSNSLFALGDERSAAWLYAGLAIRMIIDLGMHVDVEDRRSTRRFTDEDLEIRRRVFWSAFIVDKIQSLYQGRPITLKESDTLVPIKFLDTYEEFEYWRPMAFSLQSIEYPGTPAYSVSTFTALCRLSVVMGDILSGVYAERTFDKSPNELSKLLENLDSKLKAWKSSLPKHLEMDPEDVLKATPPHVFSLNAMYNVLRILLHRPFVADGHLYGNLRDISVKSFMTCVSAADHIVMLLRAYDCAFAVARAPYLISYACYVAATIHVRIAAKRTADSEAYNSLATCLAIFNRNQETNKAIQRAQHIIQGLMKRLSVPEPSPEMISGWSGKQDLAARGMSGPLLPDMSRVSSQRVDSRPRNPETSELQHPAAPPTQLRGFAHGVFEGAVSPTVGWSDIDGIIQSFVRAPEAIPHGMELAYQFSGNAADAQDGVSHMQGGPSLNSGVYGLASRDKEMPWPADVVYGAASTDDLLFGLNGAALDSFQF
ncbi:fungal specific transcription factor domain-containing protein [Akanthomyces lecanii RCEF 1005]|uniref:Fungal specific transcription factor domain-containing protein n=1 Tax=Akanthomyces lecanii RCEF 1005 TaxID=1081108 RepID=A0A162JPG1_CORDF|nr:fungal specific transcription factor domain-containing protein [Akanthomyces lecanii RCEF 1005]